MRVQEPDDETIARVARGLFNDACDGHSAPSKWKRASARSKMEYERYARDLLMGNAELTPLNELLVLDLEDIPVQDIPATIRHLVDRYELAVGSQPSGVHVEEP